MDKDEIVLTLKSHTSELEQHGVQSLALFGSVARGDFTDQSDLDILVEFNRPVGLFEFVRLKRYLEELTRRRVDLVTPDALKPAFKRQILADLVHVR